MMDIPEPDSKLKLRDGEMVHEIPVYRFGSGRPRILITAGLHGGEVTGQYAASRLTEAMKGLDEAPSGEIVITPRCNPSAFRRMQRTSPFDDLDMNRVFPGDEEGSPTQVLASRIWDVAADCDYIVDLHCAGPYAAPYALAQYQEYDNCRELAEMLDIPAVVQSGGSEGQLFVEAARRGIPAAIIELPGGGPDGIIDLAASQDAFGALTRLLTLLEFLPGDATKPKPRFCTRLNKLTASHEGLYLPQMAPGENYRNGDVVGIIGGERLLAEGAGYCVVNRPAGYVFPTTGLAALANFADDESDDSPGLPTAPMTN